MQQVTRLSAASLFSIQNYSNNRVVPLCRFVVVCRFSLSEGLRDFASLKGSLQIGTLLPFLDVDGASNAVLEMMNF